MRAPRKKNIKVLVVDDEKQIQNVLAKILKKKDYQVKTVGDGMEALKAFKKERFDIVLLDIMMPKLDGIQTLRKIKAQFPKTIVMMLTAYGSVATAREAMQLGAYDYITKPFDMNFIYEVLEESLKDGDSTKEAKALV